MLLGMWYCSGHTVKTCAFSRRIDHQLLIVASIILIHLLDTQQNKQVNKHNLSEKSSILAHENFQISHIPLQK